MKLLQLGTNNAISNIVLLRSFVQEIPEVK